MAAAERRELGRDRQRPMLRYPVAKLEKRPWGTVHNQLRRVRPELPGAEPGRTVDVFRRGMDVGSDGARLQQGEGRLLRAHGGFIGFRLLVRSALEPQPVAD